MKPSHAFGVAASVAAVILSVPTAEAAHSRPVQPASAASRLRSELRAMRLGLAREGAELAGLRKELSAAHPDIARLRQQASELQLRFRRNETRLNTAVKQSWLVQKAISTPLAIAVKQVRHEVKWAQTGVKSPLGQLVGEAALDYAVGHVSTGALGYLELVGARLPGPAPNDILAAQAGLCGPASQVFAAIVKRFGFPVRAVLFYYTDPWGQSDGHTAVEVSYGGTWHFFDPTFGQFWTDATGNVLSIAQIRAGSGTVQRDAASFTNVIEDASLGNDAWFVTDPRTRVVIDTSVLKG